MSDQVLLPDRRRPHARRADTWRVNRPVRGRQSVDLGCTHVDASPVDTIKLRLRSDGDGLSDLRRQAGTCRTLWVVGYLAVFKTVGLGYLITSRDIEDVDIIPGT